MEKGERLRYVNELTGTFVVLSMLLTIAGIFFIASAQRWFMPSQQLLIMLPLEGAHGLREEADVHILGTVAGQVQEISINQNGRMIAHLSLDPDFYQFVRQDSKAVIRHEVTLVSGMYLEITRGSGLKLPQGRPTLIATAEKDIKTVITEILASVESATLPTLQEYTKLAAELRDPQGPVQTLLAKTNRIATTLEQGDGTLPTLLNDPTLVNELTSTMTNLNTSLDQLQTVLKTAENTGLKLGQAADNFDNHLESLPKLLNDTQEILQDLQQTTNNLPDISNDLQQGVSSLPELLLQATRTMAEIERLTQGVQRHWLVRDYVEQHKPLMRIPIEQIDGEDRRP